MERSACVFGSSALNNLALINPHRKHLHACTHVRKRVVRECAYCKFSVNFQSGRGCNAASVFEVRMNGHCTHTHTLRAVKLHRTLLFNS